MYLHIDPNSSRSLTRQVIEQMQWQIVSGRIKPGDRLPSIRELSKQLGINPTTITRIYSELAASVVVVLRQGQGAFAVIKHHFGLRRFLLRGLEQVRVEWCWATIAFNRVRLMSKL